MIVTDLWAYFKRGHTIYLAFFMVFSTYIVVQYSWFLEHFSPLIVWFPSIWFFGVFFSIIYGIIGVLSGFFDYRRGSYIKEAEEIVKNSPYFQDKAKADVILERKIDVLLKTLDALPAGSEGRIAEIMEKWRKPGD